MSKTTWLYALSLCAGVAGIGYAASACTVTTTSGPLDDGGTTNGDSGSDTGTSDGGDGGSSCAATQKCAVVGPKARATLDQTCGSCDLCVATSCCTEATTCFAAAADGGRSDCDELFGCLNDCDKTDGGTTCIQACKDAYGSGLTAAQAVATCVTDNCGDAGTACQ